MPVAGLASVLLLCFAAYLLWPNKSRTRGPATSAKVQNDRTGEASEAGKATPEADRPPRQTPDVVARSFKDLADWDSYNADEKSALFGLLKCIYEAFDSHLDCRNPSIPDKLIDLLVESGWTEVTSANSFRIHKRILLLDLLRSDFPLPFIASKEQCQRNRADFRRIVSGQRYRWALRSVRRKTRLLYRHELFPGSLVILTKWTERPQVDQDLYVFVPETAGAVLKHILQNPNLKKSFIPSLDITRPFGSKSWSEDGGHGSYWVKGSKSYSGRDAGSTSFSARKVDADDYGMKKEANMGFIRSPIEISVSRFDRSL